MTVSSQKVKEYFISSTQSWTMICPKYDMSTIFFLCLIFSYFFMPKRMVQKFSLYLDENWVNLPFYDMSLYKMKKWKYYMSMIKWTYHIFLGHITFFLGHIINYRYDMSLTQFSVLPLSPWYHNWARNQWIFNRVTIFHHVLTIVALKTLFLNEWYRFFHFTRQWTYHINWTYHSSTLSGRSVTSLLTLVEVRFLPS